MPGDAQRFGDSALGPAEPVEGRKERSPSPLGRRELHRPPSTLHAEAFLQPGAVNEQAYSNGIRSAKGYWVKIVEADGSQQWYHQGDQPFLLLDLM